MFLSGIMMMKTWSGNNLMNMVWDFPMSVPWPFVEKGRRKAAQ